MEQEGAVSEVRSGEEVKSRRSSVTDEQRKEFEAVARPLMKWLCDNVHPHHTAIVTPTGAMLLEGQCSTGPVLDYVKG